MQFFVRCRIRWQWFFGWMNKYSVIVSAHSILKMNYHNNSGVQRQMNRPSMISLLFLTQPQEIHAKGGKCGQKEYRRIVSLLTVGTKEIKCVVPK